MSLLNSFRSSSWNWRSEDGQTTWYVSSRARKSHNHRYEWKSIKCAHEDVLGCIHTMRFLYQVILHFALPTCHKCHAFFLLGRLRLRVPFAAQNQQSPVPADGRPTDASNPRAGRLPPCRWRRRWRPPPAHVNARGVPLLLLPCACFQCAKPSNCRWLHRERQELWMIGNVGSFFVWYRIPWAFKIERYNAAIFFGCLFLLLGRCFFSLFPFVIQLCTCFFRSRRSTFFRPTTSQIRKIISFFRLSFIGNVVRLVVNNMTHFFLEATVLQQPWFPNSTFLSWIPAPCNSVPFWLCISHQKWFCLFLKRRQHWDDHATHYCNTFSYYN